MQKAELLAVDAHLLRESEHRFRHRYDDGFLLRNKGLLLY